MTKWIALLRGINVSGKNKIAMRELKTQVEKLGFSSVQTVLNSGNILFERDEDRETIVHQLQEMIQKEFRLEVPVCVLRHDELAEILRNVPTWWGQENPQQYDNLIFPIVPTTCAEIAEALGEPNEFEQVHLTEKAIYWSYELKQYRKSKWWNQTAKHPIRNSMTIRTADTMKKVLMLGEKGNQSSK